MKLTLRRIVAFVFDLLILNVLGRVLGVVFEPIFVTLGNQGYWIGFFIFLTYFSILESRLGPGATLGKLALSLRVRTDSEKPPSFGTAAFRTTALVAPYVLLAHVMNPSQNAVSFFFATISKGFFIAQILIPPFFSGKTWHDLLSRTAVLKVSERAEPSLKPLLRRRFLLSTVIVTVLSAVCIWQISTSLRQEGAAICAKYRLTELPLRIDCGKALRIRENRGVILSINMRVMNSADVTLAAARGFAERSGALSLDVKTPDVLFANIMYGYDIGIHSHEKSETFSIPSFEQYLEDTNR